MQNDSTICHCNARHAISKGTQAARYKSSEKDNSAFMPF